MISPQLEPILQMMYEDARLARYEKALPRTRRCIRAGWRTIKSTRSRHWASSAWCSGR